MLGQLVVFALQYIRSVGRLCSSVHRVNEETLAGILLILSGRAQFKNLLGSNYSSAMIWLTADFPLLCIFVAWNINNLMMVERENSTQVHWHKLLWWNIFFFNLGWVQTRWIYRKTILVLISPLLVHSTTYIAGCVAVRLWNTRLEPGLETSISRISKNWDYNLISGLFVLKLHFS